MFKIIIADDEGVIRRGIISMLKRALPEEIEFHEAATGNAALDLARTIKPDLIITDIQMPGLSGLDFIEALRKDAKSTSVIIISGFEDFKYAQKAISLGVKKYVTKPLNKPEFIELVTHELQNQQKQSLYQKKEFHKKLASHAMQKELRERLLLELLQARTTEAAHTAMACLKELQVTFQATIYTCAIIQYHSKAHLDFVDFSITNIAAECLSNSPHTNYLSSAKYSANEMVILIAGQETNPFLTEAHSIFHDITRKLISFYHYDFFTGIGNISYEPAHIYRSLETACQAVNYKIFNKGQHIQLYSKLEKGGSASSETINQLKKAIHSIEPTKIVQAFSVFAKHPYTRQNLLSLQEMYNYLEHELLHQVSLCQYQPTNSLPTLCQLKNLWSIPAMNQSILSFTTNVNTLRQALTVTPGNQKLLGDIIRYIREHLNEPIDLNTVAATFKKNPAYISSLFKKGTQEGFNDYLTHERIQRSQKYLTTSTLSINEIATLCGYSNPKYYSVVFKKITGQTPCHYRQHHHPTALPQLPCNPGEDLG